MVETDAEITLELPGYQVLGELGRGGASTVYLARQEASQRQVAIKVLSPALTVEPGFGKRFVREGHTVARLDHPGIVNVHDVAVVNHRPYIVMEYLPGGSLKDRIGTPIPAHEALSVLRSVGAALGHAHEQGIYHRDVKPENILFRKSGEPVLTDFGIAKSESQNTALTTVGMVVGTPRYISPEQAQGCESGARADLYALGVIFYEMLNAQPPFQASGSMSLLYAHINEPVPRLAPELSMCQGLVDDLLAKDPDHRIPDCATLAHRVDALTAARSAPPHSPWARRMADKLTRCAVPRPKRRMPVLGATLAAVLAVTLWSAGHRMGSESNAEHDLQSMVWSLLGDEGESGDGLASSAPERPAKPRAETHGVSEGMDKRERGGELDTQSLFDAAQALFFGQGAEKDVSGAARLYEEAASRGHTASQYYLGVAYGNGDGVERDERRAVHWLERAAGAGVRGAAYNLVLAKIFGSNPDSRGALKLARRLAEQQYPPVYRILGWMYNTGTGVDPSFVESVRWGMKKMVGDVTGRGGPPARVVHSWERQLQSELSQVWSSHPPVPR